MPGITWQRSTELAAIMASPIQFPPIETADEDGLLAIGGHLSVPILLTAYQSGIFPWPFDENTLAWFAPPQRCVLFFDEIHISKSLAKSKRRSQFSFSTNRNFKGVMKACAKAANRRGQRGTWITDEMVKTYSELNRLGYALSVEAWGEEKLVGGLYGVHFERFFAGESMFHTETDASKLALWYLVELLENKGLRWIDCQVMTPLLRSFGARLIPREEFQLLLSKAIDN